MQGPAYWRLGCPTSSLVFSLTKLKGGGKIGGHPSPRQGALHIYPLAIGAEERDPAGAGTLAALLYGRAADFAGPVGVAEDPVLLPPGGVGIT